MTASASLSAGSWPMEPTTSPPGTCRCGCASSAARSAPCWFPPGASARRPLPTPPWWRTPARAASSACATTGISWSALTGRLSEVSPLERYGLVDDHWAAVSSGAADASAFVRFAAGFEDEDDLAVWQALLAGLGWCDRFVEGEARERFRGFVRGLVAPAMDRLGWEAREEDADLTRALRGAFCRASVCWAPIPTPKPPRVSSKARLVPASPSIPRWRPRRSTSWRWPAMPTTTSASGRPIAMRPRRRSSCAT